MADDDTSAACELLEEIKALKEEVARLKEASQPQKVIQTKTS